MKLDQAKRAIEQEIAAGVLQPKAVTLKMLLEDRAGLNHRFLDGSAHRHRKKEIETWRANLGMLIPSMPRSQDAIIDDFKSEIAVYQERLEKMGDRVHFYASRIRELQRTIRELRKKSLETVVYINRDQKTQSKFP
ncbi:MAG: hypothetical protein QHC90_04890 [Shinella sp.]|nr:hypothetical protein [Shinella sp.]